MRTNAHSFIQYTITIVNTFYSEIRYIFNVILLYLYNLMKSE